MSRERLISGLTIFILFIPLLVLNVRHGDAWGAAVVGFIIGLEFAIFVDAWFNRNTKEGRGHSTRE